MYTYIPLWEEFWFFAGMSMVSLAVCAFLIVRICRTVKREGKGIGLIFPAACFLLMAGMGAYMAADLFGAIRNEDVEAFTGGYLETRQGKSGKEYVFLSEDGRRYSVKMGLSGLDYFMGEDFEFEEDVQYRITRARGHHILIGIEEPEEGQ